MKRHRSRRRNQLARPGSGYKFNWPLSIFILLMFITTFQTSGLFAEDRVAEGARDIAKGVSSVPRKVADTANETNILYGATAGLAEGLLDTVKGIGEGVFKILTFYSKE